MGSKTSRGDVMVREWIRLVIYGDGGYRKSIYGGMPDMRPRNVMPEYTYGVGGLLCTGPWSAYLRQSDG